MKKTTFYYSAIALILTVASCSKKDNTTTTPPTPPPPPGITINSGAQFTGTINGNNVSYVDGSGYTTASAISGNGSTNSIDSGQYASLLLDNATSTKGITVTKGSLGWSPYNGSVPDTSNYRKFFTPASYPYSINFRNGIEVEWTDPNGNSYSTSLGTGKQTGSIFTIKSEQEFIDAFGDYSVKVLVNFNCTLYNSGGTSIALTNGVYIGYFAE